MSLECGDLPDSLAQEAQHRWQHILESAGNEVAIALNEALASKPELTQLPRILACSPFCADLLRREPRVFLDLLADGLLQQPLQTGQLAAELTSLSCAEEADMHRVLRRFRARHMLRIIWRDFSRLADTLETMRDTSEVAEVTIAAAVEHTQRELQRRFGVPRGRDSREPQQFIVLAMGKLGAHELNVSSDIDLMFAYPEAGQTDGEKKNLSNEEFFIRVGQGVIAALDKITADGFVFRVDMRLRPYGESGALVHNFAALEDYYQEQGRDWERYAMVKARPVTGDPDRCAELMAMLRPFVYRRYVDFGVIDSLRNMKQMITGEVSRRGLHDNVKLGHGGIREVEFVVQCFQLVRGGRDLGLQQRELLAALEECVSLGCLPEVAAQELREAYLFLRDSEHAIQGYDDRQTQELPQQALPRAAVATVMGFPDWESYTSALGAHRDRVATHFRELIAEPGEARATAMGTPAWSEELSEELLATLGYRHTGETFSLLQELLRSPRVATLESQGRERLDRFMPLLLKACAENDDPDLALGRLLPMVSAVVRRSAYLVLLLENPPALDDLVALCGASPWIADQLSSHPVLLDELLDRASLYSAPDKALLEEELSSQVARLPLHDMEAQMDALRYFKASHVLRVAASEVAGRLPLMKVSDKLTWIAEVILEHVVQVAWADLVRKHGEPRRDSADSGFAIYGFGKLGGIELGYGSDLDLVFLYDAPPGGTTGGARGLDNAVFYTRLGQRIIQVMETHMAMGQLYKVDMRLRPSGESGMLVSTVGAFRSYQQDTAWTWEHQALVRARFVAGDPAVAAQVDEIRRETLCRRRDEAELAREVSRMRDRMREHLLTAQAPQDGEFHLKQGAGGIVDIEFMVQYAVLAWSYRVPGLARWSDNARILETLGAEGLFEPQECEALTEAYLAYRSAAHQLSLQQRPGMAPADRFAQKRAAVSAKWQQLFMPIQI